MPPRMSSASLANLPDRGSSGSDRIIIMTQQHCQASSNERIQFPQHLRILVESVTKVTIVSDNPKAPPLSAESPLFRKERGLPPLALPITGDSLSLLGLDGSQRRTPESRWESMPQPKRIDEDVSPISSLARIRQDGHLRAEELGYRIPSLQLDTPMALPLSPPDSSANNDKPPGLNIPRRRESFEVGKGLTNKEGVSLLSQVLEAFDLSEDEDEAGESWMMGGPPPPPPLHGRFKAPPVSFGKQMQLPNDVQSTLSPESQKHKSAESLSIPVRRESIDSIDFSAEDLGDFFSDDEDTEHMDHFDDSCGDDDDDDDDDDENDLYFGSSDDDSDEEDEYDEGYSFRDTCKDDSTLVSETTATTSTTISTRRSTSSEKGE